VALIGLCCSCKGSCIGPVKFPLVWHWSTANTLLWGADLIRGLQAVSRGIHNQISKVNELGAL
jgi:hypothetical protein